MIRKTKVLRVRPGQGNILRDANKIRKAIGEKYHLTFDPEHRYCITGPTYNNEGCLIPSELELNGKKYVLEYLSGCFHPFLARVTG